MRRKGSQFQSFVQRIPADVRAKATGIELAIPLGDEFVFCTPSEAAQAVRFSLRTAEPSEIKTRQALAAAYLETVWEALRNDAPVHLTHRQATALAGELYRVWADSESRARSVAMVHTPGVGWAPDSESHEEQEAHWAAVTEMWERVAGDGEAKKLEKALGPIVDRLLLTKGIRRVDSESRVMLLAAFWMALRDAFASRQRNAGGDYSLDSKAARFPEWQTPEGAPKEKPKRGLSKNSLTGLVEDWWREAKRAGRKQSTYESYRNSMGRLVTFLKHDTASRVTPEDIVRFKDYRVQSGVSPKTVKDSDLAGMKTVFGWAVVNRRLPSNPAEGITIKVGKSRKLRSKGFYDSEAIAILKHSREFVPGREAPKLAAAKRWVPWLCAFTGGRVGEMIQIRKEDIRREGKLWVLHVTPEAGPVKTDEARDVVLHRQVIEEGFLEFFEKSKGGYLFIHPKADELGACLSSDWSRGCESDSLRGHEQGISPLEDRRGPASAAERAG
ncbi:phage integrase N-terminal SAM-like domain-containing protein, partial [Bradyrhizobium sp. CSA112]|uniref:tyrosine-type recombinase/integrase n=1 Tax=Bradyrhizobium sp. CSA112 TaxID=2699170 RepID=UPI0023B1F22C